MDGEESASRSGEASVDGGNAGFDARLSRAGVALGGRDAELLRAIDTEGSLNAAANGLNRSYSRAQQRVVALEDAFGPLVERRRGGSGGGGSRLTATGKDVLARFDRLRAALAGVAEAEETVLEGRLRSREGELATVETTAGTVRALAPERAERLEVTLRADAITLHAPEDVPASKNTSARNRFRGTIAGIDRGETVVRVAVDIGAETPLSVLITEESLATLSLSIGQEVIASFKATATRATALEVDR